MTKKGFQEKSREERRSGRKAGCCTGKGAVTMACPGHPPLTPSPPLSLAAEILGGANQQQAVPSPRGGLREPQPQHHPLPPTNKPLAHKWQLFQP